MDDRWLDLGLTELGDGSFGGDDTEESDGSGWMISIHGARRLIVGDRDGRLTRGHGLELSFLGCDRKDGREIGITVCTEDPMISFQQRHDLRAIGQRWPGKRRGEVDVGGGRVERKL